MKIYEIKYKQLEELLLKCSKGEEIEHFLFLSKKGANYIALDNEYGKCFMEYFPSKDKAICWLLRSDYSSKEIKCLKFEKVNELVSNFKYNLISNYEVDHGV